ncbi:uncharacterized protein JCM15063_000322 [Sporobolomyces koalae]|uniref:uncharacterized protein n=1 Tax=Sporobolomyces koalae TaxID=500713 RepID=UPI00316E89F3
MTITNWRPLTVLIVCALSGFVLFRWTTDSTYGVHRRAPAYDRPGTLSTHALRLDGNLTGEAVPVWVPFDTADMPIDHGRRLETLMLSQSENGTSASSESSGNPRQTVLLFGDSNERAIVDELCLKFGTWASVVSSKNPPTKSEKWHADAHVCELANLRLISFMSYGVMIEKDSQLWERKVELEGPWAVEERIGLAKAFVETMGWRVDLIVFNSNLWDLMYLHDTHLRLHTVYEFSLSPTTLEAYISRCVTALARLRALFPETKVTFRTLHPLHPGRSIDFFNLRRTVQLNQAALEVVARSERDGLDVQLLDVARVLEGWPTTGSQTSGNILKDKVHLGWNPGLWMYAEMMLDALA